MKTYMLIIKAGSISDDLVHRTARAMLGPAMLDVEPILRLNAGNWARMVVGIPDTSIRSVYTWFAGADHNPGSLLWFQDITKEVES